MDKTSISQTPLDKLLGERKKAEQKAARAQAALQKQKEKERIYKERMIKALGKYIFELAEYYSKTGCKDPLKNLCRLDKHHVNTSQDFCKWVEYIDAELNASIPDKPQN